MASSFFGIIKMLITTVPVIFKILVRRTFGLSETAILPVPEDDVKQVLLS
jgi:hypothetical protein